jgi:hypothetical protein
LDESDRLAWLQAYESDARQNPFASVELSSTGPYDKAASYEAENRLVRVNEDHPFISKISQHSSSRAPATLVATAEILSEALLRSVGVETRTRLEYFQLRERVLRVLAGDHGPSAPQVLRRLSVANEDETAFERAIGEAFIVLGFDYQPGGGNRGGSDGILTARLGTVEGVSADYRVVYDGKTTNSTSVPSDKVKVDALQDFARTEGARYAFVAAKAFDGQKSADSAINRRLLATRASDHKVCGVLTADLQRIVRLHYHYGVTLTKLRGLFENANTIPETGAWVDALEDELSRPGAQVPLRRLLEGLESAKQDALSTPNIRSVRATDSRLREFTPERLIAALRAVETIVGSHWIEVDGGSGDVRLHHNAEQVLVEMNRRLSEEFGLEPRPET